MTREGKGLERSIDHQLRASSRVGSYLPARDVRRRYCVSDMTLYRWLLDEKLGFPKPYYFGRFRYWLERELLEWEIAQPRARATA